MKFKIEPKLIIIFYFLKFIKLKNSKTWIIFCCKTWHDIMSMNDFLKLVSQKEKRVIMSMGRNTCDQSSLESFKNGFKNSIISRRISCVYKRNM